MLMPQRNGGSVDDTRPGQQVRPFTAHLDAVLPQRVQGAGFPDATVLRKRHALHRFHWHILRSIESFAKSGARAQSKWTRDETGLPRPATIHVRPTSRLDLWWWK